MHDLIASVEIILKHNILQILKPSYCNSWQWYNTGSTIAWQQFANKSLLQDVNINWRRIKYWVKLNTHVSYCTNTRYWNSLKIFIYLLCLVLLFAQITPSVSRMSVAVTYYNSVKTCPSYTQQLAITGTDMFAIQCVSWHSGQAPINKLLKAFVSK